MEQILISYPILLTPSGSKLLPVCWQFKEKIKLKDLCYKIDLSRLLYIQCSQCHAKFEFVKNCSRFGEDLEGYY